MERRDQYRRSSRGGGRNRGGRPYQNKGPRKKKIFIKKARELIVLDVLLHGHPEDDKPSWVKVPLAQVLTVPDFVLYEVKIDKYNYPRSEEKATYEEFLKENYLKEVIKKINYEDLTSTSRALLQPLIERELANYEEEFINFFNHSSSITPRMHSLKLIPGIGQKHMWEIIEARQRQNFVTFQDIIDRTSVSHPEKQISQRIVKELQRDVKYYLFSKTKKYE